MYSESAKFNFLNKCTDDVLKSTDRDCIYFIGDKQDRFYMTINGKRFCLRPKKFGFFMRFPERKDEINSDLKNTCGNIRCINPIHLQLAQKCNSEEIRIDIQKEAFKRKPRLTFQQVKEAKMLFKEKGFGSEETISFAKENGISLITLKKIANKQIYSQVET